MWSKICVLYDVFADHFTRLGNLAVSAVFNAQLWLSGNLHARRRLTLVEHSTSWTFLSNHAHVLICLHRDSGLRMREIALQVGITERAVQRIVAELVESGFMSVSKEGRRNLYQIHQDLRLRHPVEKHKQISDLLRLVD